MFEHQRRMLDALAKRLRDLFPRQVLSVHAFGSRMRGDHGMWSDLDVLIVVKDKTPQLQREIVSLFADEEDRTGIPFSVIIKSAESFEREKRVRTPFYEALVKEGVQLC
jgi:predicted nucleotidyltransferase